jgi:putative glycosyl hydrolase-like family 15 (GHL15) protein
VELVVHRYWQNSDAETGFDFGRDSRRVNDFVAHDAGAWASQGARFKLSRPDGRALFYADFGTAGDGLATVLDLTTARSKGWLATHDGAEIDNPSGGGSKLVDLGKPGVAAAYVRALERDWGKNGWDGVFADDVNAWFSLWPDESIDGYASPLDYWKKAVLPLLARVHRHLAADQDGTLVANVGEWPGHPELDSVFNVADGALQEFFLVWGDRTSLQPAEVENEYESLRAAVQRGKTYYAIVHRTDEQGLRYAFCAAAIMAGRRSDLVRVTNQAASGNEPMAWSPDLAQPIGAPAGPVRHEPGSTTWVRSFSGGRVLTIDTAAQRCKGR